MTNKFIKKESWINGNGYSIVRTISDLFGGYSYVVNLKGEYLCSTDTLIHAKQYVNSHYKGQEE